MDSSARTRQTHRLNVDSCSSTEVVEAGRWGQLQGHGNSQDLDRAGGGPMS